MNIQESKTVDELTEYSVSIVTDKFVVVDGNKLSVGERSRCAYPNNAYGRKSLSDSEPDYIVKVVLARWGDTTKLPEPTEM